MTAGSINSIIPFFQNVSAFSLTGTLDKLLGGLFHKPSSTQNNTTQPTQTQQNNNNNPTITNQPQTSPKLSGTTIPSKCNIINGDLPDPQCTPGSINTSVTQDNIKNTICVSGFTKTIRPPVSYTSPLKTNLMHSYGFTDSRSNYELDHLIALEIGGNPSDVANLWPEPGYGQYNFHIKDRFENYLHNAVCTGSMTLAEAQKEITTNWIDSWQKAGQP
ncbi:MAG: hypothetical protein M3Z01_05690 [Thermoproteota archaeon]|nr:hypothetical protein [Thermoproteota archaeon]